MRSRATRRSPLVAFTLASGLASAFPPAPLSPQTPGPAAATVADTLPAEDVVWLEFAWPVGLSAEVDMEQRFARSQSGSGSDVTVRSRYRMTVRDHPRGLAVDHSGGTLLGVEADPPEAGESLRALYGALQELGSTYIVSDDGMLLDIEGLERASEALRRALEPLAGELQEVPEAEELADLLAASLSVDAMKVSAADTWASMVWFWAWEEFEPDSVYGFTADVPSPVVADLIVPMEYEVGFLRRVPCREGAAPDSCVRLEARTFPDPATMAEFLEEFTRRMSSALGEEAEIAVQRYEHENAFAVTLEPASMIPHDFRMSRRLTVDLSVDGEVETSSRVDETVLSFRYDDPPN